MRRESGAGNSLTQKAAGHIELLAPAGEPDAAYAAFANGADAVYLGLKQFSARADAVNFSLPELGAVVGFAHGQTPRRRVFVALNTLVTDAELGEAADLLAEVAALGVDALIVQDLGIVRTVRRHFPELPLHASTQMAIHNAQGVDALREMGFRRVTLARELTLDEVRGIVARCGPDLEVEVFVHGALCYAYSGLCLYSSLMRGRSGNRGSCAYPCRDLFEPAGQERDPARGGPPADAYPFSMKDLALPEAVEELRGAGVASLKIEGRKKSPLYVAAATALYRAVLDGTTDPARRATLEEDIRTVFSRPWTGLYVASRHARGVTDPHTVGHRGARIGAVAHPVPAGPKPGFLRFQTSRRVELHDGLQVDVPGQGRPFGFAVDSLRIVRDAATPAAGQPPRQGRHGVLFSAPAGSVVEVPLPRERPALPAGAAVYCSSSQEVKQKYRSARPREGEHRVRYAADVELRIAAEGVTAVACLVSAPPGIGPVAVTVSEPGTFEPSRTPERGEAAARRAFERLGDTAFTLGGFRATNPEGRFVPASALNDLRRQVFTALQTALQEGIRARAGRCRADLTSELRPLPAGPAGEVAWSVKVDRMETLDRFENDDWRGVDEVVVDIGCEAPDRLTAGLAALADRVGAERIRLALPLITRSGEAPALAAKVEALRRAGWRRWEAANLSAWGFLAPSTAACGAPDLATDWSVYVANAAAARQLAQMGVSRFVLSPEDAWADPRPLLAELGERATLLVYGDLPLFVSATCPSADARRCPQDRSCPGGEDLLTSASGESVRVVRSGCRAVTLPEPAFSRQTRIPTLIAWGARRLRAAFLYRRHDPVRAVESWRKCRG